jgi:hypothetical protein
VPNVNEHADDVIAGMFSIELYYGDRHLYGEF